MPKLDHVRVAGMGEIVVRPLAAGDEAAYLRFGAAIAPDDLRLRFAGSVRPTLALARRLLALDGTVVGAFEAGEILGVGRIVSGEIAVTVRSDLKRRGIGRVLLERLVREAVEGGITELAGYVLAENRPMLTLARTAGFQATGSEGNMVSIRLCLP